MKKQTKLVKKKCPICQKVFFKECGYKTLSNKKYCSKDCWYEAKKQRDRKWWSENKKEIANKRRKQYKEDPEKYRKQKREDYLKHIEKRKARVKEFKKEFPQKVNAWNKIYKDKIRHGGLKKTTFERDGYICQLCGSSQKLQIHHLDGLGTNVPKEKRNNVLDNLITVCCSCHTTIHLYQRWRGICLLKNKGL